MSRLQKELKNKPTVSREVENGALKKESWNHFLDPSVVSSTHWKDISKIEQHHTKKQLVRFHWNDHTQVFHPLSLKLKTRSNTGKYCSTAFVSGSSFFCCRRWPYLLSRRRTSLSVAILVKASEQFQVSWGRYSFVNLIFRFCLCSIQVW